MTAIQALLAAVIAGVLIVAGVVVLTGPGWGLIAAGAWIAVLLVLLFDPKQAGKQ